MFEVKNISMIYDMNTDEKMYALKKVDLSVPLLVNSFSTN